MTKLSKLSRSIDGKVALITGAASGLGRATACLFADEGARLALVDVDAERLKEVAETQRDAGADALTIVADCATREELVNAVEHAASHFGELDILINNAGVALMSDLNNAEQYEQSWQQSLAVMASAQQWAIRAALPWLRKAEYPRVVNVASTEALGGTAYNSAYVVAKHASLGLTRAMAVELSKEGITVNCICPGPVHTGMTSIIPDADKETFARRRTALRRYAEPEEIAHIILSVVLPAASYITGAAIPVDGGLTIRNA